MVQGREATLADAGASRTENLGPLLGDEILATYGFDGGVTGTFESAPLEDGGGSEYYRLELHGTAGILAFWSDPGSPVFFHPRPHAIPAERVEWQRLDPPPMPAPRGAPPNAGTFFGSNQAMVCDLLAAVEEGRASASSGHDARAALEMIMAVYESHLAGRRVALPLAERAHPLTRPSATR
jgi:predicted dehydrogenase